MTDERLAVRRELRIAEAWLRRRYPPKNRVVVRVCRLRYAGAISPPKRGRVFISIGRDEHLETALDALFHEWAHERTLDEAPDHGRRWRRRYGAIYSHWHDRGGRAEARG